MGELLKEMELAGRGGGNTGKNQYGEFHDETRLSDLGITKTQSHLELNIQTSSHVTRYYGIRQRIRKGLVGIEQATIQTIVRMVSCGTRQRIRQAEKIT